MISSAQFHQAGRDILPDLREYVIKQHGANADFVSKALHEDAIASPPQDELLVATDARMLFLKKLVDRLPNASSSSDSLEALEPSRLKALLLVEGCKCSYIEAAQICKCPVGTIKSTLHRARGGKH